MSSRILSIQRVLNVKKSLKIIQRPFKDPLKMFILKDLSQVFEDKIFARDGMMSLTITTIIIICSSHNPF